MALPGSPKARRTRSPGLIRRPRGVKLFPLPKERRNANLNTASFDRQGMLWFTGQNGVYGRLDPKSEAIAVFNAPRGTGPYGIAATPDGQVFFASLVRVPVESDHGFRWKMIAQSGGT
jgi:streptogramin lyase